MPRTTMCEIARAEWSFFFDAFSRRRQSWTATLEVLGPEFGAQTEARALSFEGAVVDAGSVSILLGLGCDRHITRSVPHPSHVRLERTETGLRISETLEIESPDGIITLLRFDGGTQYDEPIEVC